MYKMTLIILLVLFCASIAPAQRDYHKFEISGGYSIMRADGILGDGELFSDDKDVPLSFGDITSIYGNPDLVANPGNLFPTRAIVNTGRRHHPPLNGFNASAVYNFSKYVGAKVEVSGYYRSNEVSITGIVTSAPWTSNGNVILPIQPSYTGFTIRALILPVAGGVFDSRQQHYNFLGGVQVKNNSKEKKFKPFAQALAGVSRQSVEFRGFDQRNLSVFGKDKFTNTGFTMAFGGGIDIRLSKKLDLRVIQFDYNPVRIKEQQIVAFKQPISNLGIPNNLTFTNLSTATVFSNNDVRISSRWQNNFRVGFGIVFH